MGSPHSKYSTNPGAQEVSRTPPTTPHSFAYDKLSWNIDTKVLIEENGVITECIIQEILYDLYHTKPTHSDLIKVRFEDIDNTTKTVYRYELKSTTIFLQKRCKLRVNCMLEIYSLSLHQWIPRYIDKYGTVGSNKQIATNDNMFSVNNTNYPRWSHLIRCYPQFSTLSKGSMVSIFDSHSNQWICGQIVDIQTPETAHMHRDNNHLDLDVFIVKYIKNGKIYTKYLHEFSARLALMDPEDMKSTSNAAQYMESNVYTDLDKTDLLYHRMLFQGFGRNTFINDDVLSLLMKYTGFLYEMVMCIESKTWSLAMDNRIIRDNIPKYYDRKDSTASPKAIKGALSPSFLKKIKNKLIQRGQFNMNNFNKVQELVVQRLGSFPLITKQVDDMKHTEIRSYNHLPLATEHIDFGEDMDHGFNNSFSLESGCKMDLQSDFERD